MFSLKHEINIGSDKDTVFKALVTREGLKGWWTEDVEAKPEVGSHAVFGFFDRETVFTMNIDKISSTCIEWTCIDGPEEWIDTKQIFELEELESGTTKLRFTHSNWKEDNGAYPSCNTTWGHLMVNLKEYCEGLEPGPYFK
ncbi:MAG: SRPBCC domain-containing protein [Deltaproteobacteria bacterium]|nr:MAG: SRPBCC domain-containing protein [Deltaproteobacteria bacterium]